MTECRTGTLKQAAQLGTAFLVVLVLLSGLSSCASFFYALMGVDAFELEFTGDESKIKYASFEYELRNESRAVDSDQKLARDQYNNQRFEHLVADQPIPVPGHLRIQRSQLNRIILKFSTSDMTASIHLKIIKNSLFYREMTISRSILGLVMMEL